MKRKKRISVWVSDVEKQGLEDRAYKAGFKEPHRYYREFLMRRVRNRLDASIFDEIHRLRIELNRHGGLLVQMRNRLFEQRISKDLKNEIFDIIDRHSEACCAVHGLREALEAKLSRDDESEV